MSERTGIDWIRESMENPDPGADVALQLPAIDRRMVCEWAAQVALSRAESAITERDVERIAGDALDAVLNDTTGFSNRLEMLNAFRYHYVATFKAALRSRQSGAITEGDVDALAEKVRTQMWESPAAYDYTGGVDDLAHLVKSLLRSRQSGKQRGCVGADFDFGSQRCDCPRAECSEKGVCCFPNSSTPFTEDTSQHGESDE